MEMYYWTVSILLIFVLTAISSWLTQKISVAKFLVPAAVAVLTFILLPRIDMIFERMSEPQVEVHTNLVPEKRRIEIFVTIMRNPITSAVLDISFYGIIKDFEESNPMDGVVSKRIGENNIDAENRLKIEIPRVNPSTSLKYVIYYDPQPGYAMPTTERYSFSYSWDYRNRINTKTEWRWLFSDKKTSPPPDFHGHGVPFNLNMELPNKVLDIEMRNWYKNNIRERRLN
jgi:hypothetical protein